MINTFDILETTLPEDPINEDDTAHDDAELVGYCVERFAEATRQALEDDLDQFSHLIRGMAALRTRVIPEKYKAPMSFRKYSAKHQDFHWYRNGNKKLGRKAAAEQVTRDLIRLNENYPYFALLCELGRQPMSPEV